MMKEQFQDFEQWDLIIKYHQPNQTINLSNYNTLGSSFIFRNSQ